MAVLPVHFWLLLKAVRQEGKVFQEAGAKGTHMMDIVRAIHKLAICADENWAPCQEALLTMREGDEQELDVFMEKFRSSPIQEEGEPVTLSL